MRQLFPRILITLNNRWQCWPDTIEEVGLGIINRTCRITGISCFGFSRTPTKIIPNLFVLAKLNLGRW